jgi:hypothetical protein
MRKPLPSPPTRTLELAPRPLLLDRLAEPPPGAALPERRPADRIKDALLRWLEEEL